MCKQKIDAGQGSCHVGDAEQTQFLTLDLALPESIQTGGIGTLMNIAGTP